MDVKPTRTELMKLKKKIKLASTGFNLLEKKRDGLILEFFEIMKEIKEVRRDLFDRYTEAIEKIKIARVLDSDGKIRSLSLAVKDSPEIEVSSKNIMGVVIPEVTSALIKKRYGDRGFGTFSLSVSLLDAVKAYEDLLEQIIIVAEIEIGMKKLLREIEKTKRRVNALEYNVLPKLNKSSAFIRQRLDEQERETTFRTKRIKAKG